MVRTNILTRRSEASASDVETRAATVCYLRTNSGHRHPSLAHARSSRAVHVASSQCTPHTDADLASEWAPTEAA